MPSSYHGQITTIVDLVLQIQPKSILDMGIGFGKYGVLCREALDIQQMRYAKESWQTVIDGIEGYKGYKNPIHTYAYNHVYYNLIEKALEKTDKTYDLGLMIDVLEHFTTTEGEKLLPVILNKCKKLIVSVPQYPSPQTYLDNVLESHRSIWRVEDFDKYKIHISGFLPMGTNNANLILLLEAA